MDPIPWGIPARINPEGPTTSATEPPPLHFRANTGAFTDDHESAHPSTVCIESCRLDRRVRDIRAAAVIADFYVGLY